MSGHTPAPWTRGYMDGAATIEADSPTEPGSTFIVAMQVSERDAPLLLAAPELLKACRMVVACGDLIGPSANARNAQSAARAALAKALAAHPAKEQSAI